MNNFKAQAAQKPTAQGSLLQSSCYGSTIPEIIGQTQSMPLAIWAANLRQGGSTKKFKQFKKGITAYVENIDFLLGHSPMRGVLRLWNNGGLYPLNFSSESFSSSAGSGSYSVSDPNFYFVIAVTLEASYSFSVDDYGGTGAETLSGTWEIPLWNELETGPDPTDPSSYRNWPYCYRWQPGFGATVEIDATGFPGGTLKVYYAVLTEATSFEPPISKSPNNLFFEPQLGSGSEYADAGSPFDTQQIIYPQFAGMASSALDLGSSGAIPQLLVEIAGKWGVYPSGDADFVDMIEDVFKSGLAQAAISASDSGQPEPANTQMERGLSSYDFPGTIQKKMDQNASTPLPPMLYNSPNAAGNALVVIVNSAGGLGISSTQGEDWRNIYSSSSGWQIWYADARGGENTVTVSGATGPWSMAILEIGGIGDYSNGLMAWAYPAAAPTDGLVGLNVTIGPGSTYGPVTYAGFAVPGGLPGGAVITAVIPVATVTISGTGTYAAGGASITFPSTAGGFSVTDLTGVNIAAGISGGTFTFEIATNPFTTETETLQVAFLGLQVFYTLSSAPFGSAQTFDGAATTSSPELSGASSVSQGLPGYLLAVPFYSSASGAVGSQPAGWKPVTPPNLYDETTSIFQVFERIVYSPGEFTFEALGTAPASLALVFFKAAQPPGNPKALGDFLDLPSLELVRKQCRANGLIGSLAMTSQSSGSEWLKSLYMAADAAPVFLGDKLFSYPYSEVSAAGNGAFYPAPTAAGPVAELTDQNGDFIGEDTPELATASRIDRPNVLQLQIVSRENFYNNLTITQAESATMELYGVRKADPIVNSAIQDANVARMILGIMVRKNQYGGDVYSFTLSPRWMLLSPMDLVTITDALAGFVGVPVRLTSCAEQDDLSIACEAEPFLYGEYAPTPYTTSSPTINPTNVNESAGDVNPPVIFEPVPDLYPTLAGDQIWVVVSSGNANYGGAQVFVSTNGGASYVSAGPPIIGNSVTGELTADWPADTDPDTTNDLFLDLTESNGTLESYTLTQENNFEYPCYVQGGSLAIEVDTVPTTTGNPTAVSFNGTTVSAGLEIEINTTPTAESSSVGFGYELMAYAVATLLTANHYQLMATGGGNELRRNVFGAPGAGVDHPIGSRFAFLNPTGVGILKMNMPTLYVGQTILFKILSFNQFGNAVQSLSDVIAYSYTPTGVPGTV